MSDDSVVVHVESREDALTLHWLQQAIYCDDYRPTLRGIHVRSDGMAEAANGFILHKAPVPDVLKDLDPGVWLLNDGKPLKKSKGQYYKAVRQEVGKYPDTDLVDPPKCGEDPIAVVCLTKGLLVSALGMPTEDDFVILELYGSTKGMVVCGTRGDYRAVVMPRHPDRTNLPEHIVSSMNEAEDVHWVLGWIEDHYPEIHDKAWEGCGHRLEVKESSDE